MRVPWGADLEAMRWKHQAAFCLAARHDWSIVYKYGSGVNCQNRQSGNKDRRKHEANKSAATLFSLGSNNFGCCACLALARAGICRPAIFGPLFGRNVLISAESGRRVHAP